MNRLRQRLVVLYLAASLPPLALTLYVSNLLLERSLRYSATPELERLAEALEESGRALYQQERAGLRQDAAAGRIPPRPYALAARDSWPPPVEQFWLSAEPERFRFEQNRLTYLERRPDGVRLYEKTLPTDLEALRRQVTRSRAVVAEARGRDLPRGFRTTLLLLVSLPWLAALALLIIAVRRLSRPVQQLTGALNRVAAGDLTARLEAGRRDEIGSAMRAFNQMAEQLARSRERLLYFTRLESWQALARKMAHEVKNSLTPIRLTVEEMSSRRSDGDRVFLEQAAQIIVEEVNSLERRVRAFSDFAAEPPVQLALLDLNPLVEERVAFLKNAHPEVDYTLRLTSACRRAVADEDLLKAVLTNLLENAAEAAGPGGRVLVVTAIVDGAPAVEVHDSGPGLSPQAEETLFAPSISFKKGGMGLGLSIARKSALLCGGDIVLVKGELGGAAFRVLLSATCPRAES